METKMKSEKNKETNKEEKIIKYDFSQEPNFKFTNDLIIYLINNPQKNMEDAMVEFQKTEDELEETIYMGFLANGISNKFRFTWNVKEAINSGALNKIGMFSPRVCDLLKERIEYKNSLLGMLNKKNWL